MSERTLLQALQKLLELRATLPQTTLSISPAKEQDVGNGEERIAEDLHGVGFWVAWRER
jgi:hypothetical protein